MEGTYIKSFFLLMNQRSEDAEACACGQQTDLVDDLIATGGTAEGAVKLLQQLGAEVVAACFVVDLPDLGGRKKIEALNVPVRSLIAYEGD